MDRLADFTSHRTPALLTFSYMQTALLLLIYKAKTCLCYATVHVSVWMGIEFDASFYLQIFAVINCHKDRINNNNNI